VVYLITYLSADEILFYNHHKQCIGIDDGNAIQNGISINPINYHSRFWSHKKTKGDAIWQAPNKKRPDYLLGCDDNSSSTDYVNPSGPSRNGFRSGVFRVNGTTNPDVIFNFDTNKRRIRADDFKLSDVINMMNIQNIFKSGKKIYLHALMCR